MSCGGKFDKKIYICTYLAQKSSNLHKVSFFPYSFWKKHNNCKRYYYYNMKWLSLNIDFHPASTTESTAAVSLVDHGEVASTVAATTTPFNTITPTGHWRHPYHPQNHHPRCWYHRHRLHHNYHHQKNERITGYTITISIKEGTSFWIVIEAGIPCCCCNSCFRHHP